MNKSLSINRWASLVLFSCAVVLPSRRAEANGRFPFANQLVVDPANPAHLVARTTFGLLQSFDAGKSWKWACEKVLGFSGNVDPAIGVTQDSSILAGTFDGLSITHDGACNWSVVGAPLEKEFVIDVAVEPNNPARAVALTSTGLGDTFHVILAESIDNAKTWHQAGVDLPKDFISETVDVAPSRTDRVYASGIAGTPAAGLIERSDDRGQSWSRYPVPLDGGASSYIAAVDPLDADLLYVRIDGRSMDRDTLLVSTDGAKSFKVIHQSKGALLGFALSPDGSKIMIGGPKDGLFMATRGDFVFQRVVTQTASGPGTIGPRCLTWSSQGIYACGSEYPDGFTIGISKDEGKTFASLYRLNELTQLQCAVGTQVTTFCPRDWPRVQNIIGQDLPDAGPGNPEAPPAVPNSSKHGCSCEAVGVDPFATNGIGVISLAIAMIFARRRHPRC
ncbi:MAG: hypothetical protein NVS3B20_11880 [Polyangiales bacterium]